MHQDESVVAKANYLLTTPGAMNNLSTWAKSFVPDALAVHSSLVAAEERGLLAGELKSAEITRSLNNLRKFHLEYFPGYEEFKEDLQQTSARSHASRGSQCGSPRLPSAAPDAHYSSPSTEAKPQPVYPGGEPVGLPAHLVALPKAFQ